MTLEQDKDYNYYCHFAYKCFNYLNGKINNINILSGMDIPMEDTTSYGNTNHSRLRLYIWAIMNDYNKPKMIETYIIIVIAHELAHANQIIDTARYTADPIYHDDIENQADYHSFMYILDNGSIISELCKDFDVSMVEFRLNELKNKTISDYQELNLEWYYLSRLCSICSGCEYIGNSLKAYDTITIRLMDLNGEDSGDMFIKINKTLSADTRKFNLLMHKVANIVSDISIGTKLNDDEYGNILCLHIAQVHLVHPLIKEPIPVSGLVKPLYKRSV